MADQKIPYEFQTDFGEAARLEEIAKYMEQQRLLNRQSGSPQMVSGHYIRRSPMQGLADLFAAYQGGKARGDAAQKRQQTTDQMAAAEQGQLGKIAQMMMGTPERQGPVDPRNPTELAAIPPNPKAAAQAAVASQFPRVQNFGKELGQRVSSDTSASMAHLTPEGRAAMIQTGQPPAGGFAPDETYGAPSVIPGLPVPPGGAPVMGQQSTKTGKWNELGGRGNTTRVDVNTGQNKFEDKVLDRRDETLSKLRPEVVKMADTQRSLYEAYKVLKSGALNTGKFAQDVTELQSLAKFFNVPVPPNVPATQFFNNMLLPQITQTLKAVNPVGSSSNRELELALKLALSPDRDERAIDAMLRHAIRAMNFGLSEYNSQVTSYGDLLKKKNYDPEYAATLGVGGGLQGMDEGTYRTLLVDPIDYGFGGAQGGGRKLTPQEIEAIERNMQQ